MLFKTLKVSHKNTTILQQRNIRFTGYKFYLCLFLPLLPPALSQREREGEGGMTEMPQLLSFCIQTLMKEQILRKILYCYISPFQEFYLSPLDGSKADIKWCVFSVSVRSDGIGGRCFFFIFLSERKREVNLNCICLLLQFLTIWPNRPMHQIFLYN